LGGCAQRRASGGRGQASKTQRDYLALNDLLAVSDVVELNCPQTPETKHLIDAAAIVRMKRVAMSINTGRDGIVDTAALIATSRQ
jgi:lactate dehydrogenase-like 2-hydroxyacid dehydrogenase